MILRFIRTRPSSTRKPTKARRQNALPTEERATFMTHLETSNARQAVSSDCRMQGIPKAPRRRASLSKSKKPRPRVFLTMKCQSDALHFLKKTGDRFRIAQKKRSQGLRGQNAPTRKGDWKA